MNDRGKELLVFVAAGIVSGLLVVRLAASGAPFLHGGPLSAIQQSIQSHQQQVAQSAPVVRGSEENAIINTVDQASPSVVAIGVTQSVINPFDPFAVPTQQQSTIGTGFVISNNGTIVTNRHVVADTTATYTVVTKDGKKLNVTKIYRDPVLDLAIIEVSNSQLKAIAIGDSSKLKVGQTAIAIGNALGKFDNTVTTGVVSGLQRAVSAGDPYSGSAETLNDLIQTDAAINPGNSGGPLLNSSGQVIGVNVATTEGAQNIGFAIPINGVKDIVDQFEKTGTVSRPFLGVRYMFVPQDTAISHNLQQGAYIEQVVDYSPADKAGLKAGDIITKIDDKTVDSQDVISSEIQSKKVGDSVSMQVWNNNNTRSVNAQLSQAPSM